MVPTWKNQTSSRSATERIDIMFPDIHILINNVPFYSYIMILT